AERTRPSRTRPPTPRSLRHCTGAGSPRAPPPAQASAAASPAPPASRTVTLQVHTDTGAQLHEFNGEPDHVHLLLHDPPTIPSRLLNRLKGGAPRHLRQDYRAHLPRYRWGGHLWFPCYFATSCGGPPRRSPTEHIKNQKRPG